MNRRAFLAAAVASPCMAHVDTRPIACLYPDPVRGYKTDTMSVWGLGGLLVLDRGSLTNARYCVGSRADVVANATKNGFRVVHTATEAEAHAILLRGER